MTRRKHQEEVELTATDKTKAAFSSAAKGAANLAKNVALVGVAAAGVALGGMAALGASSLESMDALAKSADAMGTTTQSLAAMRHAGELANVSVEQTDKTVKKMNDSIGDAARGTGEAVNAFKQLGLSAADLAGMSADQAFAAIADELNNVESFAERTSLAMDIFGRGGAEAMNLIAEGSAGIAAAAEDAERLGISVSRIDAAKAELANDAMTRLGKAFEGVGNRIAVIAAPMLKYMADLMVDGMTKGGWLRDGISDLADGTVWAVGAMADSWQTLQKVWATVKHGFFELSAFLSEKMAAMDQSVTDFINIFPGMDAAVNPSIAEWAAETGAGIASARAELAAFLTEPPPSEAIFAKLDEIRAAFDAEAGAIADKSAERIRISGEAGAALRQREAELDSTESARRQDREEKRLALRAGANQTLEEAEIQHLARMDEAEERSAIRQRLTWEKSLKGKIQTGGKLLGELAGLQDSNSKKMFAVGKAAAAGETLVNAYKSATAAYASLAGIPVIGPALGAAAYAAALASGLASAASIKSQSFGGGGGGGGGSAPSVGGGASAPVQDVPALAAPANAAGPGTVFNVTFDSATGLLPTETVIALLKQIDDVTGDGFGLNVAAG